MQWIDIEEGSSGLSPIAGSFHIINEGAWTLYELLCDNGGWKMVEIAYGPTREAMKEEAERIEEERRIVLASIR